MKKLRPYLIVVAALVAILWLGLKKNVNTGNMQVYQGDDFTIYYETLTQKTLEDMEKALETAYPVVQKFFGVETTQTGKIIVYKNIGRFQRAYLGLILSWVYDDWASGAAYQDSVLLTSPENPGTAHTYSDTLEIMVHEYVHTRIFLINEMPPVWLDEGVATYLSGQKSELSSTVPSFEALQSDDMGTFLDNNGYAFGYEYIAFLDKTYGSEKIIRLIQTNNYEEVFGKPASDIYGEWLAYLKTEYPALETQ
ncbi:MAG: hypothetical protein JXA21_14325 [Anaerolineae bacterium]|nr:hypothetical protein [Anaerolineae bacterium]